MKDHQVTIRTIIDVAQGKTINIILIIKFRIRELHVQKCTRLKQSAFKHQKARNSNWPLMFHGILNKIVTFIVLCKHDPVNFPLRLNNPQYVDYKYSSILDDKRYLTSVHAKAEIFLMEVPLFVCFWGISTLLRSNSATFQDYAVLFGSTWVTSQKNFLLPRVVRHLVRVWNSGVGRSIFCQSARPSEKDLAYWHVLAHFIMTSGQFLMQTRRQTAGSGLWQN